MTILRKAASNSVERPSLKIILRVANKYGLPLDEQEAWNALLDAFKDHPYLEVAKAQIRPDKDSDAV